MHNSRRPSASGATPPHRLRLTEVEETTALPRRASVSDLLAPGHSYGQVEILPARSLSFRDWHPTAVSIPGGRILPDWWTEDPILNSRPVCLYRVPDAYYMPYFGVVISSSGD